jgi:hypothetical protein
MWQRSDMSLAGALVAVRQKVSIANSVKWRAAAFFSPDYPRHLALLPISVYFFGVLRYY